MCTCVYSEGCTHNFCVKMQLRVLSTRDYHRLSRDSIVRKILASQRPTSPRDGGWDPALRLGPRLATSGEQEMPCSYHVLAMVLPCSCVSHSCMLLLLLPRDATFLPYSCHSLAMLVCQISLLVAATATTRCHVLATFLPRFCHALAMNSA